jgi:hypothetical protein
MSNYAIYDISTGRYFQTCTAENLAEAESICSPQQAAHKVGLGFSTGAFYCDNGASAPIPPQPSPHHVFNYTTKQWEDPRTLAALKAAQWTAIKQARSAAEYAGFTWDGSTFDSDAISQNRITGAVALAQMSSTFSIGWVLADNTVRTLSQSDMLQVGAALGAHVAAIFAKGVLLREAIEAATTVQQIEAVVW